MKQLSINDICGKKYLIDLYTDDSNMFRQIVLSLIYSVDKSNLYIVSVKGIVQLKTHSLQDAIDCFNKQ